MYSGGVTKKVLQLMFHRALLHNNEVHSVLLPNGKIFVLIITKVLIQALKYMLPFV